MEEKEKTPTDYSSLKKGALLLLILAFILFNASKLFTYIGAKHTVDAEPYPTVRKTLSDSIVGQMQKKLDSVNQINDSIGKKIIVLDTVLQKKTDTIAKQLKRKPLK